MMYDAFFKYLNMVEVFCCGVSWGKNMNNTNYHTLQQIQEENLCVRGYRDLHRGGYNSGWDAKFDGWPHHQSANHERQRFGLPMDARDGDREGVQKYDEMDVTVRSLNCCSTFWTYETSFLTCRGTFLVLEMFIFRFNGLLVHGYPPVN